MKIHKVLMAAVCSCIVLAGCGSAYVEEQDSLKESAVRKMEDGEYDKALEQINEALALAGTRVTKREIDLSYYKAAAQYAMGDYDFAMETCDNLIKYNKKDAKAYFLRACTYIGNEDPQSAVEDFKTAASLMGEEQDEVLLRGFISLMSAGYTEDARAYFDETKDLMTDQARILYEQIAVMETDGNYSGALRVAEEYLKLKPEDEAVSREYEFLKSVAE